MMAWLPVFYLYFTEHLEMKQVLWLESIYYISVVLLEVPSGFFSDKFGRRLTLIVSSILFLVSYVIFGFSSPSFFAFAVAQIVLAGGMSFMSGTNTAFYYESLQELNREHEFPELEARVQSLLQYSGAFAVLSGGFVGAMQLNLAYVASLIFIFPACIICFLFNEPDLGPAEIIKSEESQLGQVVTYLKIPELRWMFLFTVVVFILAHIPYEFYQPYLNLLDLERLSLHTAITSGIVFAISRIFGAFAAGKSVKWVKKFGLKSICTISVLIQLIIIGVLALFLNPVFIILLLFRSFSMSLVTAPMNAEIAPRVRKEHRTSYFSLQSLASRLSFSLTLILLSLAVAGDVINDWSTLSLVLMMACGGGIIISIPLLFLKSGSLFKRSSTNF